MEGREGKGRRVPPLDLNPGDATGSLKSHMTSYKSSIETIALKCLVFENSAFLHFGDRQTNRQTNR